MYALKATKTQPNYNHVLTLTQEGLQKMAYVEWGENDNPNVIFCIHGLTRNGRDFDFLAKSLQSTHRIICPDLLGCGASGYLESASYTFAQYMNDMMTLMGRIGSEQIHWVGTSLGGILGMMLAAQPNSPIKSLVLNDVGMIVPSMALKKQEIYARNDNVFQSLHEAKSYFQTVMAPSSIADPLLWEHITHYGIKRDDEGNFRLAHDPAIGARLSETMGNALHLESYWKSIKCPVLIIRGEDSDFLPAEVVTKMLYLQPRATVVTIPDCGHAPSLMTPDQIGIVNKWMASIS